METKKAISQLITNLDNLEKLSRVIKQEVMVAAQVIELADVQQREFKSQNEALRSEHEILAAQIEQAKAELTKIQRERVVVDKEVRDLRDEHRRLSTDILNIRKRLSSE